MKLVKNLQKLFAMMIRSHKKYIDPTNVLNTIVDDLGINMMNEMIFNNIL